MILSLSETRSPHYSFPEAFPNLDLCAVLLLLWEKKWIVLVGNRQRAGADLLHFYIHKMFAFLLINFFLILVLKLHRTQEKELGDHPSNLLTSITPLGSLVPVLLEVIEGSAGAYRTRGLLGYPLYAGTHLSSPCFSLLPSRGSQLPTGAT